MPTPETSLFDNPTSVMLDFARAALWPMVAFMAATVLLRIGPMLPSLFEVLLGIAQGARRIYRLRRPGGHASFTADEMEAYVERRRGVAGRRLRREYDAFMGHLCFAVKLYPTLVRIRASLVGAKHGSAWTDLWNSVVGRLQGIDERIALWLTVRGNAENADVEETRAAILADAQRLIDDMEAVRISLEPRLDAAAKARLLGLDEVGMARVQLSEAIQQRMQAIGAKIDEAMRALPAGAESDDAAFTLKEIRGRYLPDTIAAYVEAQKVDQAAADRLLDQQLGYIESGAAANLAAVNEGRLMALEANGEFLRERLAASTEHAR